MHDSNAIAWPECYGFEIYGQGPCYVTAVRRGSIAYRSGLLAGDQILEVDGKDARRLTRQQMITVAQSSPLQTPMLSVMCCAQRLAVMWSERFGYGFTTQTREPCVVEYVDRSGPAGQSGLQPGDIIVDKKKVSYGENKGDMILLSVVPVGRKSIRALATPQDDRSWRAKQLYVKMKEILGDDYELNMLLVTALKRYAETRHVGSLCRRLKDVLTTAHTQNLITYIRNFIPANHLALFDNSLRQTTNGRQSDDSGHYSGKETPQNIEHQRKAVQVYRKNGNFGFVLRGSRPVYIETVDQGGPADRAGLEVSDAIVKINEVNVRDTEERLCVSQGRHHEVVQLLHDSGPAPVLMVLRNLSHDKITVALPDPALLHTRSNTMNSPSVRRHWKGSALRQQLDYLLTSNERIYLKQILKSYSETGDIETFITRVEQILDTPSKRSLWQYITPCLTAPHENIVHESIFTKPEIDEVTTRDVLYPADIHIGHPDSDDSLSHQSTDFSLIAEAAEGLRVESQVGYKTVTYNDDEMSSTLSSESPVHEVNHAPFRGRLYKKNLNQNGHPVSPQHVPKLSRLQRAHSSHSLNMSDHHDKSPRQRRRGSLNAAVISELHEARRVIEEARVAIRDTQGDVKARYVTLIPIGHLGQANKPQQSIEVTTSAPLVTHQVRADNYVETSNSETETLPPARPHRLTVFSNPSELQVPSKQHTKNLEETHQDNPDEPRLRFNFGQTEKTDAEFTIEMKDVPQKPDRPMLSIPPPPPPPPLPLPPPIIKNCSQDVTPSMNIKRINWEKLDIENVDGTVWSKVCGSQFLDDVLDQLELDQQFSTKPIKAVSLSTGVNSKKEISILSPKKAYNISILLGHLRLSVHQMKACLYSLNENVLTPQLLKQLITYAPDSYEWDQYSSYSGDLADLSLPDQFMYEMNRVTGYMDRLNALLFKVNFTERTHEIKQNLLCVKRASEELHRSKKLTQVFELILAMGNHLNKGNSRVGDASAFRVHSLTQLSVTKTSDKKSTFLHVLVKALNSKSPQYVTFYEDLTTVHHAARVSVEPISQELEELRKTLEEVTSRVDSYSLHDLDSDDADRYYQVISNFTQEASERLHALLTLHSATTETFWAMARYFGEDPHVTTTAQFFSLFSKFFIEFQKAYQEIISGSVV